MDPATRHGGDGDAAMQLAMATCGSCSSKMSPELVLKWLGFVVCALSCCNDEVGLAASSYSGGGPSVVMDGKLERGIN